MDSRFPVPALPLTLATALAACDLMGPAAALPGHAVALAAPPQYLQWWTKTEACAGRLGRLDGIAWYVVPDATAFMTPKGEEVGNWSRGSDGTRIVIADAYVGDELVVRHEMLHALLDRGDHPPEYFVDRCHLTWASSGG